MVDLHALALDERVPACSSLVATDQDAEEIDRQTVKFTPSRAVGDQSAPGPG